MSLRTGAGDTWTRLRVAGMARRKEARRDSVSAILEAAAAGDASARVNCVVFSKNRAMQLEACLRSIERFAPYDARVTAVYTTTDAGFAEGYDLLSPPPGVHLVAQSNDFQRDVLEALDRRHEYTVFHSDDDLFFRPAPASPLLSAALAAFSLRLGRNTRYCYPRASVQPVPDAAEHGPYIAWSWPRAQLDFAYPLSLDGHVMRTDLVRRLVAAACFSNPNELEDELHRRRCHAPPFMAAFRESCLVSLPVNIVASTHRNRFEADRALTPEALNRRFVAGERIDLDSMDFTAVDGAHAVVPFAFASVNGRS